MMRFLRRRDRELLEEAFVPTAYRPLGRTAGFEHFLAEGLKANDSPSYYFDPTFYREQLGVNRIRQPLILHFLQSGAEAGFLPHPLVDPGYLLRSGQIDERSQVLKFLASNAGRTARTHPMFWGDYYLDSNPDISEQIEYPLHHYLTAGHRARRRREPNPFFSAPYCEMLGLIDRSLELSPLEQFLEATETLLSPTAFFDPVYYLRKMGKQLMDGESAYSNFMNAGLWEEHDPNILFDGAWYRERYGSDVPTSEPAVLHYLRHEHEGCFQSSPKFSPAGVPNLSVKAGGFCDFGGRVLERYLAGGTRAVRVEVPLILSPEIVEQVKSIAHLEPAASDPFLGVISSGDSLLQNFNLHATKKAKALEILASRVDRSVDTLLVVANVSDLRTQQRVRTAHQTIEQLEISAVVVVTDVAIKGDGSRDIVDFARVIENLSLQPEDACEVFVELLVGSEIGLIIDLGSDLLGRSLSSCGEGLSRLMAIVEVDGEVVTTELNDEIDLAVRDAGADSPFYRFPVKSSLRE